MNRNIKLFKTKKYIWIIFLISCINNVQGQASSKQFTTLYTYGDVPVSTKMCLENLFSNFTYLFDNVDWIQLKSYKYIGIVKKNKHCKRMLIHNLLDLPKWIIYAEVPSENSMKKGMISLNIDKKYCLDISCAKEMASYAVNTHIGDEIYEIVCTVNLVPYTCYIFINPKTLKVFDITNMWGFKIPLSCFEPQNQRIKNE